MIGDEYYAWQVRDEYDEWTTVGALVEGTHVPLMVRHLDLVEKVRYLAERHSLSTGQPLRLAHFTLAEVVEGVGAP